MSPAPESKEGAPMDTALLIDGRLVAGEGLEEQVLNPATGNVIAKVPEASSAQLQAAVEAASRAFDGWARTIPMTRAHALLKLADHIEREGEAYARLESLNCGKPLARVIADEIPA